MAFPKVLAVVFLLVWALIGSGGISAAQEPVPKTLPPGIQRQKTVEANATQRTAIGTRLGGTIDRLTNNWLTVGGRPIQVNRILAASDSDAAAIHSALLKIKPEPFCFRSGLSVFEYVGEGVDEALARRTTWELGLLPRPAAVTWRVNADLGLVDQADFMACNPLFHQFLLLESGQDPAAADRIRGLAEKFRFGKTLRLRNEALLLPADAPRFDPPQAITSEEGSRTAFQFDNPPVREGVPFVKTTLQLEVDDTGFTAGPQPDDSLLDATRFWPSDDPAIVQLARQITAGREDADDRAQAILEWLAPGKNIRYSGQTGSRWGTEKVLEQKFGHCWDFSDCFVTLARAAGIPARQVAGWYYGSSGHVWAEYYSPAGGWRQVDPTGAGRIACGIFHIAWFTSNDGDMPVLYLSLPRIEWVGSREKEAVRQAGGPRQERGSGGMGLPCGSVAGSAD